MTARRRRFGALTGLPLILLLVSILLGWGTGLPHPGSAQKFAFGAPNDAVAILTQRRVEPARAEPLPHPFAAPKGPAAEPGPKPDDSPSPAAGRPAAAVKPSALSPGNRSRAPPAS